jgi:hypothetical protein
MADAPDYRRDKSASLEGQGIARARWQAFHDAVPEDVWERIAELEKERFGGDVHVVDTPEDDLEMPSEVIHELAVEVVDEADLLGFYIAWHRAGGFANLQRAGWHRATIHRKIRRFRARFGQHPDELFFSWLRLDLDKIWRERIVDQLHPVDEPDW